MSSFRQTLYDKTPHATKSPCDKSVRSFDEAAVAMDSRCHGSRNSLMTGKILTPSGHSYIDIDIFVSIY